MFLWHVNKVSSEHVTQQMETFVCLRMCVWVCFYVCMHMCVWLYEGQRSASGVFLNCSCLYFVEACLSLNMRLTDSAWLGSKPQRSLLSLPPWIRGIPVTPGFLTWVLAVELLLSHFHGRHVTHGAFSRAQWILFCDAVFVILIFLQPMFRIYPGRQLPVCAPIPPNLDQSETSSPD